MGRQATAGVTQTRPGSAARDQAAPGFFTSGPQPPGSLHAVAAGSRYASAQLDPQPASAARARRLTRETLTRWDMASLTDDAEIISAEIVANAINAVPPGTTGLAIVYAIHATPSGLRIYTWNIGPGHPVPANPDPDAVSGRGLTIINALTERWGWWPTPAEEKSSTPPSPPPLSHDSSQEAQMEHQPPPPPLPRGLTAPYALRMMLIRRYSYLTLKFSSPVISKFWPLGSVVEWRPRHDRRHGSRAAGQSPRGMQDCGAEGHWWETTGERREPVDEVRDPHPAPSLRLLRRESAGDHPLPPRPHRRRKLRRTAPASTRVTEVSR